MRKGVILLAIAICMLIMLPGLTWGLSAHSFAIVAINLIVSLLVTILIMNRTHTGKWTNGKKLWFDD